MSPTDFILPPIAPEELTPTVRLLLAIIEQQQVTISRLEQRVEQLEGEVARLKRPPPRPSIKPSTLDKDHDDEDPPTGAGRSREGGKRPGSKKRRKRPKIHRSVIVAPENLPPGSCLLGYQDYLLQDLQIEPAISVIVWPATAPHRANGSSDGYRPRCAAPISGPRCAASSSINTITSG